MERINGQLVMSDQTPSNQGFMSNDTGRGKQDIGHVINSKTKMILRHLVWYTKNERLGKSKLCAKKIEITMHK